MATRTVSASAANAGRPSMLFQLAGIVNALTQNGLIQKGTLAKGTTTSDFKTTTVTAIRVAGVQVTKAATDNIAFSGTSTINNAGAATTAHYGAFLVQMDAAGTVSTKHAAYTSGTDQDYATEAAAIAALPAADAGNVALGYITVQGKASLKWTEATDDLTAGSDCTAATFYDADQLAATDLLTTRELGTPA